MSNHTAPSERSVHTGRKLALFCALLLLTAQTIAQIHAHQVDTDQPCAVCLLSADELAAETVSLFDAPCDPVIQAGFRTTSATIPPSFRLQPRAPPFL